MWIVRRIDYKTVDLLVGYCITPGKCCFTHIRAYARDHNGIGWNPSSDDGLNSRLREITPGRIDCSPPIEI